MYRAGSLVCLRNNINPHDSSKVVEVFEKLNMRFEPNDHRQHIFLNEEEVTPLLHSPEVTAIVPIVAAHKEVRSVAKEQQRKIGLKKDTVMTGRDIGSEIFPEAKLKFFITASTEVRAQRRFDQLKKVKPEITYEEVLNQMLERDKQDSEREASPMRIPEGAVVVDTSDKTIEESVSILLGHYQKVFEI
ncbi:(d)CMP kinase [Candidatus Daviesbacteria bacterium]|nr:(d)CMP kinase [Candidatus Daviesbacteria bacterium]